MMKIGEIMLRESKKFNLNGKIVEGFQKNILKNYGQSLN